MIPKSSGLFSEKIIIEPKPTRTYAMDGERKAVAGYCDNIQAMKQVVFKILNTQRYENMVYSWNYGIELSDLLGKSKSTVCPEIKRRITEALTQDDRIQSVGAFVFDTTKRGAVYVTFTVETIFGQIQSEKEVEI